MSEKEALLALRSELSYKTKNNHSYSFSNEELNRLLSERPTTLEDLGKIKGFPKNGKRIKAFGQQIVDIFNGVCISKFNVRVCGDEVKAETILKKSNAFIR